MFTSSVTECLANYLYHCFLPLWEDMDKWNRSTTWISAIYITLCQGCCQWEVVLNSPMIPYYLLNVCKWTVPILRQNLHFFPHSSGKLRLRSCLHTAAYVCPKEPWPCLSTGEIEQREVLVWEKLEYSSGFFTDVFSVLQLRELSISLFHK